MEQAEHHHGEQDKITEHNACVTKSFHGFPKVLRLPESVSLKQMFFYLSKILAFLVTPITWIVVLFVYGWFTKNEVRKKRCFKWGIIVLLVFSNRFLFDEAMRAWEVPAVSQASLKHYDAAIVLGGLSSWDPTLKRIQFHRGGDRLFQAIELYKKGLADKILITGGSGSMQYQQYKEADYIKQYMLDIGIPESAILIERESKNTYENAVMTKKLLQQTFPSGGNYLLITSAIHMRRSKACFDKAGVRTLCYSTDRYTGPRKFQFDHLVLPDASTLSDWYWLLHEITGYLSYKAAGYL